MYTCTSHITFQHFGILQRISYQRVGRCLCRLQFRYVSDSIGKIQFLIRDFVGNQFGQTVGFRQGQLLYTGNVLDSQFGCHGTIRDDMRHLLLSVLYRYPTQHFTTPVIIEVHINIRQRNTVRIKETLKQQVILDRVYLRNTQTISHSRTGCRTTSRPHRNSQLRTGGIDKVLYNQEVTRETHRLHDVQLKHQTLFYFIRQRITVNPFGAVKCQFGEIVGFQLDTIKLFVTAQTLYFGFSGFLVQDYFPIFVLRKFIEQIFFRIFLPVSFFCSEILGNGESRHDRSMVYGVVFHLVQNLQRIGKRFRNIGKKLVHLRLGFHPLLLGIKHTARIVQILARTQTDKAVVRLGILLVHKVNVIGADYFYIVLPGIFQQFGISFLL